MAAAEGQQAPDPPLTELESLQLKCNNLTDESLESTRRMKGMCEEAKDCGIKTLVMLDDQGEQLEKFEKGVDQINSDMRLAEQALRSMDLLCGIFPKFWKKSGGFKEDDAVWGDQKVGSLDSQCNGCKSGSWQDKRLRAQGQLCAHLGTLLLPCASAGRLG